MISIIQREVVLEEKFLLVRKLKPEICLKPVMEPFSKNPRNQMAEMDWARRGPSCIKKKLVSLLILIQQPLHVAVGEKDLPFQKIMKIACVFFNSLKQGVINFFSAKTLNELV